MGIKPRPLVPRPKASRICRPGPDGTQGPSARDQGGPLGLGLPLVGSSEAICQALADLCILNPMTLSVLIQILLSLLGWSPGRDGHIEI